MFILSTILACSGAFSSVGCGGTRIGGVPSSSTTVLETTGLSLSPLTAVSSTGGVAQFVASMRSGSTNAEDPYNGESCDWTASDDSVATPAGDGTFHGLGLGTTTVSAVCAKAEASATLAVTDPQNPNAIRITHGGTYTGNWSSNDPNTPAVTVVTDDPVTITNSTVTGRGTLIMVFGGAKGANLTLTNTTGTAMDPGVAGKGRGKFLDAQVMNSLTVKNCTMKGTSFGVYVVSSNLASLSITNNVGINLEDRVSDGHGGLVSGQRVLGHFIMLNADLVPKGGEIAWNQIINATGNASIEDIVSIYQSRGGDATTPIRVHDNYLEGAFSTGLTKAYTGGGIQFDGGTDDPAHANGFVEVTKNVIVRTANMAISIGAGHDISVTDNRIVSCGQDGQGHWINMSGPALVMWNYYNTHQFHNNRISGNTGGLIAFEAGTPVNSDFNSESVSTALSNLILGNHLEHPCWVNGVVSQAAEAAERSAWMERVSHANMILGDQH